MYVACLLPSAEQGDIQTPHPVPSHFSPSLFTTYYALRRPGHINPLDPTPARVWTLDASHQDQASGQQPASQGVLATCPRNYNDKCETYNHTFIVHTRLDSLPIRSCTRRDRWHRFDIGELQPYLTRCVYCLCSLCEFRAASGRG